MRKQTGLAGSDQNNGGSTIQNAVKTHRMAPGSQRDGFAVDGLRSTGRPPENKPNDAVAGPIGAPILFPT